MYPYFLFTAIYHLKSSPTFSVQPRSSDSRVTVDLIRRSRVRFPPRSKEFFSLPRVVPWFPLLGLTPSGSFMGFTWHFNLHFRVNSLSTIYHRMQPTDWFNITQICQYLLRWDIKWHCPQIHFLVGVNAGQNEEQPYKYIIVTTSDKAEVKNQRWGRARARNLGVGCMQFHSGVNGLTNSKLNQW